MRNFCRIILALVLSGLCAEVACAQFTTVTAGAGSITIGANPISSGTVVFVPVDASGRGIAVTLTGGGLNLPPVQPVNAQPIGYTCTITNGAITGTCSLPDENTASPSGFAYNATFLDTSTGKPTSGQTVSLFQIHGVTGATWQLDHYAATTAFTTVSAFTVAQGIGAPTGTAGANSWYSDITTPSAPVLYEAVNGAWVQVVGNTSAVTATAIASALGGRFGCNLGNTAYNPQTNTCLSLVSYGAPLSIPAGDIADYHFLDGSGSTVTDLSGHNNVATLGSGAAQPVWTNTGLSFSGNEIVNLPAALNTGQTFAMGLCINPPPSNAAIFTPNSYPVVISSTMTSAQGLSILYQMSPGATSNATPPEAYAPTIFARGAHSTQTQAASLAGCHTYVVTLGTSGTSVDHIYVDGVEVGSYGLQGTAAGAQSSGNLIIGASSTSDFFSTSRLDATVYRLVVYPTPLTSANVAQLSAQIADDIEARGVSFGPPLPVQQSAPQLLAIGDSITNGVAGGGVTPWENLMTLVNQPNYSITNDGVGGLTLTAIAMSEANRIAPQCSNSLGQNVAIVFAGTNDFNYYLTGSASGDVTFVFSSLTREIRALKQAGCKVFVGTMLSRGGNDSNARAWDLDKDAYDALILTSAKTMGADGIIDFAADATLGADGANATATFQADHIHPTQAGQNRMGVIASNALNYYFGYSLANPNVVTATTYTLASGDRAVTAAPTANAAYTMPDCTGPSGEVYTISNPQSAFTLSVIGGSGQPINGLTTAITIPSNSTATLRDVANPKATGGCHWVM